jgi:hypothetical protein
MSFAAEVELGRVETVRLLRDPALWIALAVTGWGTWTTAADSVPENTYFMLLGYSLIVPGFVIVVHTVLAVLRSRMAGTEELLCVVPVGPDRRTLGHGVTTLGGGGVGVVAIAVVYLALRPGSIIGRGGNSIPETIDLPRPNLAQLLQGPFAVVAVTAFAVALVRWIPTWVVLAPLLFLAAFQALIFGVWLGAATGNGSWWFPLGTGVVNGEWIGCGEFDVRCDLPVSGFDQATPWWHLAYLVAITVMFVVVAVLRHRRDRLTWTAFAASLTLVVALAIIQAVVSEKYVPALAS